jgi:hypothetical protein
MPEGRVIEPALELSAKRSRRHSGSNRRQRTASILVRLTPEERAAAEAAASRAGLSVASYARGQMLGGPPPRAARRPPVEKEQLARILAQLGKIGSNLNQIARASNMGLFTTGDYEALRAETRGLMAARAALMDALGRSP